MQKKALIVGINNYKISPLTGMVNDASDWARSLHPETQTKMLLNGYATKNNILDSIKWLISETEPGDSLALIFCGNGTTVLNQDRDIDECLCPVDFELANVITPKELREQFDPLPPGRYLDVVLSCCFSGSATPPPKTKGLLKEQYIIGPTPTKTHRNTMEGFIPPGTNGAIWHACGSGQTTWEAIIGAEARSFFSYYMAKSYRQLGIVSSRAALHASMKKQMLKIISSQDPWLEADRISNSKLAFA